MDIPAVDPPPDPRAGAPPHPAAHGGRWVVLGLLLLGLAAATGAWLWNYQRGRRALKFLGPATALLIRRAPTVELVLLKPLHDVQPAAASHQEVVVAGQRCPVAARIDLSRVPGMLNARTSLLQDASFRDEPPRPHAGPLPPTLLRFADGSREAWIGLDLEAGLVIQPERSLALPLVPKTAAGWRDFLHRQRTQTPRTPGTGACLHPRGKPGAAHAGRPARLSCLTKLSQCASARPLYARFALLVRALACTNC